MKKKPIPLVAVFATALTLAACSTPTTAPTDSPEPKDTFVVAPQYATESLDPHGANSGGIGTTHPSMMIYSRLIAPDENGQMRPDLAESWEPNESGTQYTFHLRQDAVFSDGTPVTSAEVVASLERLVELQGPASGNFAGTTIEAPDQYTVILKKDGLILLGQVALLFVTKADVTEESFTKPVGSGPFVVKELLPSESLTLVPNETYYGAVPKIGEVNFRWIPEISTRLTALQTGEIDATWGIPDDQVAALTGNDELRVEQVDTTLVVTMWFNHKRPAFQDAAVRNAIWQAIDFDSIIATLFPESGTPSLSNISPNVFGYSANQAKKYDPAAARAALEASGFDFGQTLQIQYKEPEYTQFLAAMASDLAEIGVTLEPVQKEAATWLEDFNGFNWDINFQQIGTAAYDAAQNTGRLYPCAADRNGYCNPDLDALLADAAGTADQSRRAELYAEAGAIVWDEAIGMFPMLVRTTYAWNANAKGFVPDPLLQPNLAPVSFG
ncbi:MAG: ABC transporter substrate-binding protein [Bifidobacteriaceae bacterium]|jgi:peptide/nickel transport system substrate-binding protein|nr:ABC transporter substrate-binding protein [Bifidobacteriaceae bacterium]